MISKFIVQVLNPLSAVTQLVPLGLSQPKLKKATRKVVAGGRMVMLLPRTRLSTIILVPSTLQFQLRSSVPRLFLYKLDSSMPELAPGKVEMDQLREQNQKESTDSKDSKRLSGHIIPHILNLYGSSATPRDFEIYAPNATFEDPLMCAHGVNQIKSAFYSVSKVFSESKIVDYSIEENVVAPGKGEVLIDNKQHYKFLGKDLDVISLIKLRIEEGKVVRHEDWWDKKPLWNRDTVKLPLVGRVLEMTRRASMLSTHVMMGFGKDPSL